MQPCVLVDPSCPSSASEKPTPRALPPSSPTSPLACHSRLPFTILLTAEASAFVWIRNAMFEERSVVGVNHLTAESDSRWRHWRNWVSQYLKLFCLSRPHHAAKECNPGGSAAVMKFCVWSNDTATLNRAWWYWLRLGSQKNKASFRHNYISCSWHSEPAEAFTWFKMEDMLPLPHTVPSRKRQMKPNLGEVSSAASKSWSQPTDLEKQSTPPSRWLGLAFSCQLTAVSH